MGQETAHIEFAYDGVAVADGRMEVRYFAPALLAMSDLVHEANARLNGDLASISVRVNSEFKGGSFLTGLTVVQTVKRVKDALLSDDFKASEELLKLLGLARTAGDGVIQLHCCPN